MWMYIIFVICFISARVGLMHIGVFILLLLSGERNFGVRLNKPYTVRVPMDIPVFTGTHADFLIIVSDSMRRVLYKCRPSLMSMRGGFFSSFLSDILF